MSEHDKDILISRLLDGDADESPTGGTWDAFRAMAERDPTLWRELAEAQRQQADLAAAVAAAVAVADTVDAPTLEHITYRFSERMRLVGSWGGWAAAAAIVLVWATGFGGASPNGNRAGIDFPTVPATSDEALKTYLDRGQRDGVVVGEVPTKVLIDARLVPGGDSYEVLFLRQIMERRVVRDMYQLGFDESGRQVPVRVDIPGTRSGPY